MLLILRKKIDFHFKKVLVYVLPKEQRSEDEHDGDVERHEALEEEFLEVVGHVSNDVEENCWQEGGEDEAE